MAIFMPIILGVMLAWNLLTDWVWIGNSLNFLPSDRQKDLQNRARNIIDLMNSAKSMVYAAQKDKRKFTSGEAELLRNTADLAEKQITELNTLYKGKFLLYGKKDVEDAMQRTIATLRLELENYKQLAGIVPIKEVANTKITATVVAVHDGDTLTLDNKEVVRLVGIDAPESVTAAGQASKAFLISLVMGKKVSVESDPAAMTDIYGRRLGVIWIGERNINVEMLKNGYASFYFFEPNALVYKKVWEAAAAEGKAKTVTGPITDLKTVRNDSYEKLRMWRTAEKAAAKLAIDEEKERYKSEQNEALEELKDNYALIKETNKAEHSEILANITDLYKAKAITLEERASRRSAETTRYLEVRTVAAATYREAKLKIKDPYKAEKSKLTTLLAAKYKEINDIYTAKRKEIALEYNANVAAIKDMVKLPYTPEVTLPPSVAPPVYVPPAITPVTTPTPAEAAVAAVVAAPVVAPLVTVVQYAKVLPWGSFWKFIPEKQGWTANIPAAEIVELYTGKRAYREVTEAEQKTWKIVIP